MGEIVGLEDGDVVGDTVGLVDGLEDGDTLGEAVGLADGLEDGDAVGEIVRLEDGDAVGEAVDGQAKPEKVTGTLSAPHVSPRLTVSITLPSVSEIDTVALDRRHRH